MLVIPFVGVLQPIVVCVEVGIDLFQAFACSKICQPLDEGEKRGLYSTWQLEHAAKAIDDWCPPIRVIDIVDIQFGHHEGSARRNLRRRCRLLRFLASISWPRHGLRW